MRLLILLALFSFQIHTNAQTAVFGKKAAIYVVRHAEKGPGNDPLLTDAGNKRAGDLMRKLKKKKIRRIYVTEFRRTQNTGDSMRIQLGIDTVHYIADTTGADLLEKIKQHHDLNTAILVIGHSNTVPKIIQKLGLPAYPRDYIPDKEFDNLFLLTYKKGKPKLTKAKYGALSGASATMQ